MFRTAWKGLLGHKFRFVATALAVTLGVAFMAGTLVLTDTIRATFDNLFADVYQGTDAVVRAQAAFEGGPPGAGVQRGRVDASLVDRLRRVDGVAAAEGDVGGYARLVGRDGKALGNPATGAPTIGLSWTDNAALNTFTLVSGTAPSRDDEVVIDRKSARDAGLSVGDTTTVLVRGPPQRVRIAGIARFGTADSPGGATIVAFRRAAAQRLVGEPGKYDTVSVLAAHRVSQDELVSRLSKVLPPGTEALTGAAITAETQSEMAKAFRFFDTFMLIFAVIALLVGSFMIFNTFSITVAQRTRENGLLRALGASRRQVLGSVLLEAAAVGVLASLLGIAGGFAVALGLKGLLAVVGLDIPTGSVVFTPATAVISFAVGVGVTVLAALSPARKAAKVPPVAAMQEGVTGSTGYGSKQRVMVGAAVLGLGLAALLLGLFRDLEQPGDDRRRRRPAGLLRRVDPGSDHLPAAQPRDRSTAATAAGHHRISRPGERDAEPEAHGRQRVRPHDRCRGRRPHHDLRVLDQGLDGRRRGPGVHRGHRAGLRRWARRRSGSRAGRTPGADP